MVQQHQTARVDFLFGGRYTARPFVVAVRMRAGDDFARRYGMSTSTGSLGGIESYPSALLTALNGLRRMCRAIVTQSLWLCPNQSSGNTWPHLLGNESDDNRSYPAGNIYRIALHPRRAAGRSSSDIWTDQEALKSSG
jgi:hypothetical protein